MTNEQEEKEVLDAVTDERPNCDQTLYIVDCTRQDLRNVFSEMCLDGYQKAATESWMKYYMAGVMSGIVNIQPIVDAVRADKYVVYDPNLKKAGNNAHSYVLSMIIHLCRKHGFRQLESVRMVIYHVIVNL